MSAKKHILAPQSYTAADADRLAGLPEGDPARLKLHRMSAAEAGQLAREGRLQPLGSSGKVWQRREDSFARPSRETGEGRVSLEIPFSIQAIMAGEMRRKPAWRVTI